MLIKSHRTVKWMGRNWRRFPLVIAPLISSRRFYRPITDKCFITLKKKKNTLLLLSSVKSPGIHPFLQLGLWFHRPGGLGNWAGDLAVFHNSDVNQELYRRASIRLLLQNLDVLFQGDISFLVYCFIFGSISCTARLVRALVSGIASRQYMSINRIQYQYSCTVPASLYVENTSSANRPKLRAKPKTQTMQRRGGPSKNTLGEL